MAAAEAKVLAISISERRGIPKRNVGVARLIEAMGLEGDAHAGPGPRQVSLLADESIEKMRAQGPTLRPGAFAENITTVGIDLMVLPVGTRFFIGDAELEVTQIGKLCHRKCAIFDRVGDCVMPREGIFAGVIRGGQIRVGDPVRLARE